MISLDSADLELIEEARDHIGSSVNGPSAAISDIDEVLHRYGASAPAGLMNAKADLEAGNPEAAKQKLNMVIDNYA